MATESERVVQMKAHFMQLHEEGWSIPEIADKYNLSKGTVYRHLASIASQNGVTREVFLQQVHQTPTYWARQSKALKVDGNQLLEKFDVAQNAIKNITGDISSLITIIEEDMNHDII